MRIHILVDLIKNYHSIVPNNNKERDMKIKWALEHLLKKNQTIYQDKLLILIMMIINKMKI
jgi:hypothetical protein